MARVRYTVRVHARRGDQPAYTYVEHSSVKPGKVERVVEDVAVSVRDHETRGDRTRGSIEYRGKTAIVRVDGCKFVVRAWRKA